MLLFRKNSWLGLRPCGVTRQQWQVRNAISGHNFHFKSSEADTKIGSALVICIGFKRQQQYVVEITNWLHSLRHPASFTALKCFSIMPVKNTEPGWIFCVADAVRLLSTSLRNRISFLWIHNENPSGTIPSWWETWLLSSIIMGLPKLETQQGVRKFYWL